ncbi:uncharacterized protein BO97DRAFT_79967 [Aspergillus homomorphus CBS 101889]|uniref:Uncharacterized protein n=1 Tax=Aspergillus homomorphus (strain CBS 101889) TaxID=1450537 RepID=A0A395IFJ6_ASPHC|nr:hypothetical protein BO97DRAFT_79967 [Aspergillus homomorphus CBS 101889]RAL16954.1 hypothetical protein BO97DRAFT_79967 [Aspergillus homomorphus CBS 101889]
MLLRPRSSYRVLARGESTLGRMFIICICPVQPASLSPLLRRLPSGYGHFPNQGNDLFEYEQMREAHEAYAQRTAELTATQTGERLGVKAYIIVPPLVYGRGSGWFKKQSHQIPTLIRNAIATGYAIISIPVKHSWITSMWKISPVST